MTSWLQKQWTTFTLWHILLIPFSWVFAVITSVRKSLYKKEWLKSYRLAVPVMVIGNINVGGTGKTPLVIWLAEQLQLAGYKPGIISRGYGGKAKTVQAVFAHSNPQEVGDEPVLIAQRTRCPVFISPNRVVAGQALLQVHPECNVVISDDGLQHYRLGRDIEIAIVDGARRFGNQHLLPAGPLRESISRLMEVDFIIAQQFAQVDEYEMSVKGESLISLNHPDNHISLISFKNKKVHAVAAIGNPQRFFTSLKDAGIEVVEHVFPDHYLYQKSDFEFDDALPIVMTEKDAVKCSNFAMENAWYLPVTAKLDPLFENKLNEKLEALRRK